MPQGREGSERARRINLGTTCKFARSCASTIKWKHRIEVYIAQVCALFRRACAQWSITVQSGHAVATPGRATLSQSASTRS